MARFSSRRSSAARIVRSIAGARKSTVVRPTDEAATLRSMADRPWRSLVAELTDAGHESPYLDRLRRRLDVSQGRDSLETEIIREMAAALGRAEDKVNAALLELELAGRALATAVAGERRRCAASFNARRATALRARWELLIHREALGMRRNDVLEQLYPIPPAVPTDNR